jgi:hypothetical protein
VVVGGVTTALVVAGVEAGVVAASDGEAAGELAVGRGKESVSIWLNVLQAPVYDSRSPGAATEKSLMGLLSYRRTKPNARHQNIVHSTALFHPPLRFTIAHHANKDVPPDLMNSTMRRRQRRFLAGTTIKLHRNPTAVLSPSRRILVRRLSHQSPNFHHANVLQPPNTNPLDKRPRRGRDTHHSSFKRLQASRGIAVVVDVDGGCC